MSEITRNARNGAFQWQVELPEGADHKALREWCKENVGEFGQEWRWRPSQGFTPPYFFMFKSEIHAIHFLFRYSGDRRWGKD